MKRAIQMLMLSLATTAAGCAVDRETPQNRDSDDPRGGPRPIDCERTCDRLYQGCDGSNLGIEVFGDDPAVCLEMCEAGAIDAELDCVSVTPCGAIPRACFGDE